VSDRVPSDHPSVETFRAHLARSGGTRRPCLRLPDDVAVDPGSFVRLVLDGESRRARVDDDARGLVIRGAYPNLARARAADGENLLVAWADAHGREPDDAVELDEVVAGDLYGLRVPGTRAVYEVSEGPSESLANIAESLGRDDGAQ
jgi:hypothetical protein